MLVVSVDPGGATGISVYDTDTGSFTTEEVDRFIPACERIYYWLDTEPGAHLVMESYIVTARTAQLTQQTEALRLIGVGEWEAHQRGHTFSLQPPSVRKKGEAKLKTLGWFRKTKDGHSNSSSGHLLVWLLKNNLLALEDRAKLVRAIRD